MNNKIKKLGTGLLIVGAFALIVGVIAPMIDPPGASILLNLFK